MNRGNERRYLALAAVALIAAAVLISRNRQTASKGGLFRSAGVPSETAASEESKKPKSTGGSLYGMQAAEALNFSEFMDLMGEAAQEPEIAKLAAGFKKGFLDDPVLAGIYEDFRGQDAAGQNPEAQAFMDELRAQPAYRKLVIDMGSQAGAQKAARTLASFEGVANFLKQELFGGAKAAEGAKEHAGVGKFEGAKAVDKDQVAAEWAGKSRTADSSANGVALLGAARLVQLGGGGEDKKTFKPTSKRQGTGAAAGEGAAVASASGQSPSHSASTPGPPPSQSLSNPGAIVPLGAIRVATSETMDRAIREWLNHWELNADAYSSQSDGIWDLCFKRHELKKCHDACQNPPQTISTLASRVCAKPSGDYPYWEACKQANFSETDCLKECREQSPPCVVHPTVYYRECVAPTLMKPKRLPHPNCGGGSPPPQQEEVKNIKGQEAWECKASVKKWGSDGRCFIPGKACCVSKAHYSSDSCNPGSPWRKTACECTPSNQEVSNGALPYQCGKSNGYVD